MEEVGKVEAPDSSTAVEGSHHKAAHLDQRPASSEEAIPIPTLVKYRGASSARHIHTLTVRTPIMAIVESLNAEKPPRFLVFQPEGDTSIALPRTRIVELKETV